MIDGTEKPKIPSKFAKRAARYNEFGCKQEHNAIYTLHLLVRLLYKEEVDLPQLPMMDLQLHMWKSGDKVEAGRFPGQHFEEASESPPKGRVGDQDPGNQIGCHHHRAEAGRFPGQRFGEA